MAAALVCALAHVGHAATALILDPPPGFKLAEGQRRTVEARIAIGDPAAEWRLAVAPVSMEEVEITLAEGIGDIDGVVGEVAAAGLGNAVSHELRLHTVLGTHRVPFFVPDHHYVLIPFTPGDFEHSRMEGRAVDRQGQVVVYGAPSPEGINVLDRADGQVRTPRIDLSSTEGQAISGDGLRFYYRGRFDFPQRRSMGLGYLDLATEQNHGVVEGQEARLYSVDHHGDRLVFQRRDTGTSPPLLQYFLHDRGSVTQITNAPDIAAGSGPLDCPRTRGTKPLIAADGSRVIIITKSALGMEGVPSAGGCKIFAYDVDAGELSFLYALEEGISVDSPTLSDDGRWLSYTVTRVIDGNTLVAHGGLLDLESGDLVDPIAGIVREPTFDSVVTPDGEKVVISTTADLDPRVGNSDRNMELFLLNRLTGEVTQVTDTVGGIASRPGSCETFQPRPDGSGDVILSDFKVFDGQVCRLDGPQATSTSGLNLQNYRAVRKRPGNRGPVLAPLVPVHAEIGRTVELPFGATDPDGDPISLFIQLAGDIDIPAGARVVDHRDGTALMTWRTRPEQRGTHRLRVAAFDEGGGETFEDVTVTVSHSADCDGDGRVDTAEVRRCVASALGAAVPQDCRLCDADGDGAVTIDELVRGVVASGPVG